MEKGTKLRLENDVLDSPGLSVGEKCSGYRYMVYRFPTTTKMTKEEQAILRLLLLQDLNRQERNVVMETLRVVHRRDELEQKKKVDAAMQRALERKEQVEAAEALLALTSRGRMTSDTKQGKDGL